MNDFKLSTARVSLKLLVSVLLCMIGLVYLTLIGHIYIDTQLLPDNIVKAYGAMEYIELTEMAHHYLPYYALYIFALPVLAFMFTSYSEKLKIFYALFPFAVIVLDIASMFAIPYVSHVFGYILWAVGTCLALTFLSLFALILYDLWLRKPAV